MAFITPELAERLETAEALDGVDCAEALAKREPGAGAAAKAVAGGFVLYLGAASPLTHALGIGMHGPVTAGQLDEVEEFYRSRDSHITIDVCPYADPTLFELLGARGYKLAEFSNMMFRALGADDNFEDAEGDASARAALSTETDLWSETVIKGFFSREFASDDEFEVGRILFEMAGGEPVFGLFGGEVAGAASASYRRAVASLYADATLVRFRRRGVHRAMIRKRIATAVSRGCDVACAGTQPGSGSQRDYERLGFQVAYTKITMTRE